MRCRHLFRLLYVFFTLSVLTRCHIYHPVPRSFNMDSFGQLYRKFCVRRSASSARYAAVGNNMNGGEYIRSRSYIFHDKNHPTNIQISNYCGAGVRLSSLAVSSFHWHLRRIEHVHIHKYEHHSVTAWGARRSRSATSAVRRPRRCDRGEHGNNHSVAVTYTET